jgi:hypothetical protein
MEEKFEQKGVVSRGDQVLHPELHAECERKFEQMQRDLQAKVEQQKSEASVAGGRPLCSCSITRR